jgi:hypothetical protein
MVWPSDRSGARESRTGLGVRDDPALAARSGAILHDADVVRMAPVRAWCTTIGFNSDSSSFKTERRRSGRLTAQSLPSITGGSLAGACVSAGYARRGHLRQAASFVLGPARCAPPACANGVPRAQGAERSTKHAARRGRSRHSLRSCGMTIASVLRVPQSPILPRTHASHPPALAGEVTLVAVARGDRNLGERLVGARELLDRPVEPE